jgi:hypothetical protein
MRKKSLRIVLFLLLLVCHAIVSAQETKASKADFDFGLKVESADNHYRQFVYADVRYGYFGAGFEARLYGYKSEVQEFATVGKKFIYAIGGVFQDYGKKGLVVGLGHMNRWKNFNTFADFKSFQASDHRVSYFEVRTKNSYDLNKFFVGFDGRYKKYWNMLDGGYLIIGPIAGYKINDHIHLSAGIAREIYYGNNQDFSRNVVSTELNFQF